MRSAFDIVSACASVLATTKSTPWSPAPIMLLTALPPAPPTPNTVIRGFISRISGIFRLMLIRCLSCACAGPPPARMTLKFGSEAFAQPSSDLRDVAAGSCHQMPRSPRFEVFEMRRLRVDQESRRDGKRRSLSRIRQSAQSERTPDTHGTIQNSTRQFRQADELARAAGQHDTRARL